MCYNLKASPSAPFSVYAIVLCVKSSDKELLSFFSIVFCTGFAFFKNSYFQISQAVARQVPVMASGLAGYLVANVTSMICQSKF